VPALIAVAGRLPRLIADRGHDANSLRQDLKAAGTKPIIPGRPNRKRPTRHDRVRYAERWRIEAMFCRLKDYRRVRTRYDKFAIATSPASSSPPSSAAGAERAEA